MSALFGRWYINVVFVEINTIRYLQFHLVWPTLWCSRIGDSPDSGLNFRESSRPSHSSRLSPAGEGVECRFINTAVYRSSLCEFPGIAGDLPLFNHQYRGHHEETVFNRLFINVGRCIGADFANSSGLSHPVGTFVRRGSGSAVHYRIWRQR